MCFVAVAMADVPSCQIEVTPSSKIVKGQEMGMFHFGGLLTVWSLGLKSA